MIRPQHCTFANYRVDYDRQTVVSIRVQIKKYRYRNAIRAYAMYPHMLKTMNKQLIQRFWRHLGAA